jgi:hypothetical protein
MKHFRPSAITRPSRLRRNEFTDDRVEAELLFSPFASLDAVDVEVRERSLDWVTKDQDKLNGVGKIEAGISLMDATCSPASTN